MTTAVMLAVLAASHGSATLTSSGPAADSLRAQGVKLPAKLVLPITAGTVSRSATLDMGKRLTLRRGKRSVTLSRWQARLGTRATLTARVAGRRILVLRGRAKGLRLSEDSARLQAAAMTLDRGAARVLKRRLGLPRAPQGRFGRVTVRASLQGAPPARPLTPSTPGSPPTGGGNTNPPPATDPLPTLARPAGAADVVSATITWHARESFVDYINSGGGTSTENGATSTPPYDFHFPVARGWRDPASGDAALYYTGRVNFRYPSHGIDMQAEDPEIELNGADSRAIFRMDGKREVLIDLHPEQAASHTVSPDGKTHTYEKIPGTVPEGSSESVFAGFYLPGDEFGWVSVRFSTA
jgi:Htaa protein